MQNLRELETKIADIRSKLAGAVDYAKAQYPDRPLPTGEIDAQIVMCDALLLLSRCSKKLLELIEELSKR